MGDENPPLLLEARGLVKEFPGVRAVDGVSLSIKAGEIHALVGENGAGKSTLVNMLTGIHQPDAGSITVRGMPVSLSSGKVAIEQGIRVIHQELAFVPSLDVGTNLCLGDLPLRQGLLGRALGLIDRDEVRQLAANALARVASPVTPELQASAMSVAQAQLAQIAGALAAEPDILILDEPTSALSAPERDELFTHLVRARESGVGILYISHRLEEVLHISNRITVLRDGGLTLTSATAEITDEALVQAMSGRAIAVPLREDHHATSLELVRLRNATREPYFRKVDFTVHQGEIVGIAGMVGSGRTEVARCVAGIDPLDSGAMFVKGVEVTPRSASDGLDLGIAYATEDRKDEGLIAPRSVRENILLGPLSRKNTRSKLTFGIGLIRRRSSDRLVNHSIKMFDIRPRDPSRLALTMSGGNQQKIILARLFASEAQVLLLDEPTRGIDVVSKREIWNLIHGLAADGKGIVAVSSEVPELLQNVDRIVVMKRGSIAGELRQRPFAEEDVIRLAVGNGGGRNYGP